MTPMRSAASVSSSPRSVELLDVGGLEQALHLEHMTLLWVRMVRLGKPSPHLVWAALQK